MVCPSDSFSIFNIFLTLQFGLTQEQVWSSYGSLHPISASRLERDKLGNRASRVVPMGFRNRLDVMSCHDGGSQWGPD